MIEKLKLYTRVDQYGNNAVAVPPSIMEIKDKINELVDEMNRFHGHVYYKKDLESESCEYKIYYTDTTSGGFKSETVFELDAALARYNKLAKETGKGKAYSTIMIVAVSEKLIESYNGIVHSDGSQSWLDRDAHLPKGVDESYKERLMRIYEEKNNKTD